MDHIKKLEPLLNKAMYADGMAAIREMNRLKYPGKNKMSLKKLEEQITRIEKQLKASIRKKRNRKKKLPELVYNTSLPIFNKKDNIIDAILKHQILIISGETGSGKSTQIPKLCLAAGRGLSGKIGCTQPRRLATITVANRVAEELGEEIGKSIGYKIRFNKKVSEDSFVKFMTDGILLAETQGDPYLNEYDTIIVDEAHERSLNIDFILGILKTLLIRREDLKLIITSATIDKEKFSTAFDNAPIIEVSGRMYPLEVRYIDPLKQKETDKGIDIDLTHVELAVQAVDELQNKNTAGDMLIFMPTEQDIRETCELLTGRNYHHVCIFPLFARLSTSEQSRVFARYAGKKIIVSTNIAETSITIPGIKYVIDTGLARINKYSPRSRVTALPVVRISKSSADQRKGRCGRVENGICIRLYSKKDFETRPFFTAPEILRANLAEVILRMISLKLGDIAAFPFIDRPAPKSIKDGFDVLLELGAIRACSRKSKTSLSGYTLTKRGRIMAKMPVDPRLSRMLIEAQTESCVKEIAIIISALSIQSPRERPVEKEKEADQMHTMFIDQSSDFLTLLTIWNTYQQVEKQAKSKNQMKRFCRDHYLSFKRMREWQDIHTQINTILKESNLKSSKTDKIKYRDNDSRYGAIHRSILSGYLSNIAVKKEKNYFQAAKGRQVMIFPGSALFKQSNKWIVAAEMVKTTRFFARTVANIDEKWLEDLGGNLCRKTYLNPHWEKNCGEVVAFEQVSLFGLVIIEKRRVSYGRTHPEEASLIFIQKALVEENVNKLFPFMKHNKKLVDKILAIENKVRRRDILVSEDDIFRFYQKKLPAVYDIETLQEFLQKKEDDSFLCMNETDLLRYMPDKKELSLFPDRIKLGSNTFECNYSFKPGKSDDGVTVNIPSALAHTVPQESIDWLVPGLYREKITALIKGLPKEYRKHFVPVSDTVEEVMREMPKYKKGLLTTLATFIYQTYGLSIPASAWPIELLSDHLKMRISITSIDDKELISSRDTSILRHNLTENVNTDEFESAKKEWEKSGLTSWNFEDLPDIIHIPGKNGITISAYPGLEEDGKCVNLRLFQNRDNAVTSHKKGIAALFSILFSRDLKFLKRNLALPKKAEKMAADFGGIKSLENQLYQKVTNSLLLQTIRSKNAFDAHAEIVAPMILTKGNELVNLVTDVLVACYETKSKIHTLITGIKSSDPASIFLKDLHEELRRLVPETFVNLYETERLVHLVRYIKAIKIRAQRASVNFEKDKIKSKEIMGLVEGLNKLIKELSSQASQEKRKAIEKYFWLIEEYKVSVFAQELKTPFPISKKRLNKALDEIKRMP